MESLAFPLFVLVVLVFVGAFAVGTQYNVRLGNNTLKWLQKGLPQFGERASLRWLGSSVVELKINKAKDPFRTAEVLVAMEPRDVPVLWLFGHTRGRRDLLILRAQLKKAPHFDVEARLRNAWMAPAIPKDGSTKYSAVQGGVANNLLADYRGNISPFSINRLILSANVEGLVISRLAVHGSVPNLEVQYLLPKLEKVSAQRVCAGFKDLGDEVLKM